MGGFTAGMGGAFNHPINMAADAAGIAAVPMTGGASLALPVATNALSGYKAGGMGGALGGATLGAGAGLGGSYMMDTLQPSALGGMLGMAPSGTSSLESGFNSSALGQSAMQPAWGGASSAMQSIPSSPSFSTGYSTASSMLNPTSYFMNAMNPSNNSVNATMMPQYPITDQAFLNSNSNLTGKT